MKKIKEKFQKLFRAENVTGATITALLIGAVIVINVIAYALTVGYGLYYTPTEKLDLSISSASDEKFSSYEGDGVDVIFCRSSVTFDEETGTKDQTYYFHTTAKEIITIPICIALRSCFKFAPPLRKNERSSDTVKGIVFTLF